MRDESPAELAVKDEEGSRGHERGGEGKRGRKVFGSRNSRKCATAATGMVVMRQEECQVLVPALTWLGLAR